VLRPGGALAIWSAAEAPGLVELLDRVFDSAEGYAHDVLLQDRDEKYWLYVARVTSEA